MRSGIILGALGLALGAVSFALCFFSPIAAGLTGLAAGIIAFVVGALISQKGSHDEAPAGAGTGAVVAGNSDTDVTPADTADEA